jgi:hypothetical protein
MFRRRDGWRGFKPALRRWTVWRSVHEFIESRRLGGLAYAYHPAASHRKKSLRHRQRIWIGRDAHSAGWHREALTRATIAV